MQDTNNCRLDSYMLQFNSCNQNTYCVPALLSACILLATTYSLQFIKQSIGLPCLSDRPCIKSLFSNEAAVKPMLYNSVYHMQCEFLCSEPWIACNYDWYELDTAMIPEVGQKAHCFGVWTTHLSWELMHQELL